MKKMPEVQPLSYKKRQRTFGLLLSLFLLSLPFLYLYATGYRFDINRPTNFISTGGIYVAAERTGAEIYIDGELVRETRVFRKAFYAQNLDPKTHRVHVQKEGHQTWVKELPVSPHLVTEAQAFNLLLVPSVRVISEWQSATGSAVVRTDLLYASTTNEFVATTTKTTKTFTQNTEYTTLLKYFATSTKLKDDAVSKKILTTPATSTATTTGTELATTTKEYNGVRLYEDNGEVYAAWVGLFEQMPYYYCAAPFPPYSTSTEATSSTEVIAPVEELVQEVVEQPVRDTELLVHPVQSVPKDAECTPKIRIDRKWQTYSNFDFFPGSTDLVLMELENGIYVVEIDNRSWQNVQPLIMGEHLKMHIENGSIYVYDGTLIYQIILEV